MGNKCLKRRQDNYALSTQSVDTLAPIILFQQQEQQYKSQISTLEEELELAKEDLKKQIQKTQNIQDTFQKNIELQKHLNKQEKWKAEQISKDQENRLKKLESEMESQNRQANCLITSLQKANKDFSLIILTKDTKIEELSVEKRALEEELEKKNELLEDQTRIIKAREQMKLEKQEPAVDWKLAFDAQQGQMEDQINQKNAQIAILQKSNEDFLKNARFQENQFNELQAYNNKLLKEATENIFLQEFYQRIFQNKLEKIEVSSFDEKIRFENLRNELLKQKQKMDEQMESHRNIQTLGGRAKEFTELSIRYQGLLEAWREKEEELNEYSRRAQLFGFQVNSQDDASFNNRTAHQQIVQLQRENEGCHKIISVRDLQLRELTAEQLILQNKIQEQNEQLNIFQQVLNEKEMELLRLYSALSERTFEDKIKTVQSELWRDADKKYSDLEAKFCSLFYAFNEKKEELEKQYEVGYENEIELRTINDQLKEYEEQLRQIEKQYQNLGFRLKSVEQELQETNDTNNSLLKQIETTEKKLQDSKSNLNQWYSTFSTELFQKSFLKILPNKIKMNLSMLVKIENITDMLKSAYLTIHMFDITDSFNENIDQIPSGYLSLKLNKHYWNYNNKRATPSNIQQWTTLYHGTSKNVSKEIIENNLKGGQSNGYGGNNCRITNTIIASGPKANIYFSSSFKEAETYAVNKSEFQGNQFKVLFQCKVNPQGYKSPYNMPTYFTVENNMNIIPEFMLVAP